MSELIKSIRIRPKQSPSSYKPEAFKIGILDLKVSILKTKNGRACVSHHLKNDGSELSVAYTGLSFDGNRYKDKSDNDLLDSYISLLSKNSYSIYNVRVDNINFDIIQDPFDRKAPIIRSYGFDPYYLNNDSKVFIEWLEGNDVKGGFNWSDLDGNELDSLPGELKSSYSKRVTIISPSNYTGNTKTMVLASDGIKSKEQSVQKLFSGLIKDKDILNEVISYWKSSVPNYNLEFCSPNNISCGSLLEFISPVDPLQTVEPPVDNTPPVEEKKKIKLNIVLPKDLQIRVKQDVPVIKVYIGDISKSDSGFIFSGEEDDSSLIGEEFLESDFMGLDEESVLEEQEYPDEQTRIETIRQAERINNEPYVPGKYVLDLIPGEFLGNNKIKVKCCQIDGRPVNIKIADAVLDMKAAAKKDGVDIILSSGFRPDFYPNIDVKSQNGVKVTAQSQEELYQQNCVNKGGKCSPDTARPGNSKHGSGIAIDLNTGSRGGKIKTKLDSKVYTWLVKNSWRFGFVRTVASEEWHFEYWKDSPKLGPYAKLSKSNTLFYADLGLNNLSIT